MPHPLESQASDLTPQQNTTSSLPDQEAQSPSLPNFSTQPVFPPDYIAHHESLTNNKALMWPCLKTESSQEH